MTNRNRKIWWPIEIERYDCECDYYKAMIKISGLELNVSTKGDFVIDTIYTIDDPLKEI